MKGIFRMAKTHVIAAFRERSTSFWILIYPLLLMLFMYMALSGLRREDSGIHLTLGISAENPYVGMLDNADIVKVVKLEQKDAEAALKDGKIDAYVDKHLDVVAQKDGMNQQIAVGVLTQLKQHLAAGPKNARMESYAGPLYTRQDKVENSFAVYFYNVVAMFSLYGYYAAADTTRLFQANQSTLAQRHAVSPIRKTKGVLAGFIASLVVICVSMTLVLILSELILKLGLITRWGPSLLILAGGMIAGIAWGILIGALNIPEWAKTMIGIAGTLIMAMLSGMMSMAVRNQLLLHAPIINRLNPVSILTEGFFRVNILGDNGEALSTFLQLLAYTVVMLLLSVWLLRKKTFKEV